ncbi:ABC transporter ATP-binding protein [Bacteroidota bacterium]
MLLSVQSLTRFFQKGGQQITAVDDISFDVQQGEFLSVVGRSGSGKSTLLNLVGGLDTPTSGEIVFNGTNIAAYSRHELALHRRYNVGMIFQSFNLINTRNAIENVILAMVFGEIQKKERINKTMALLENVGLGDRMRHTPSELSGGETQRVAIARALANDPKLLLADEPSGNLDSQTSGEIMDLLLELNKNQGLTIMMVTHDITMADNVSNRVIRLLDGKIVEERRVK